MSVDPAWEHPEGFRHDAGDPEQAFPVPFTMVDGFGLVVWSIAASILVAAPAFAIGLSSDNGAHVALLTIAIQLLTIAGVTVWLQLRGALTWRLLGPVRPRWRHVAVGLGLGITAVVLVLFVAELTDRLFGPFGEPEQALLEMAGEAGLVDVLLVFATVFLAPLVEETIYRGVLFQSTRRRLGLVAGMVVSSLVFAYVHLELVGVPPAIVGLVALGLWLSASFHRTGTLVVPIVTHATYNAIVLGVTLYV